MTQDRIYAFLLSSLNDVSDMYSICAVKSEKFHVKLLTKSIGDCSACVECCLVASNEHGMMLDIHHMNTLLGCSCVLLKGTEPCAL